MLVIVLIFFTASSLNFSNYIFDLQADESALQDDYQLYQQYSLYLKHQKKQKYKKYRKYAKYKEAYAFSSQEERVLYKDYHAKYRLFKQNPVKYAKYAAYFKQYRKYSNYKKYYEPHKKYSRYKNYKKFNKKSYDKGKNYGGVTYKEGYDRYLAAQKSAASNLGEADLGGGSLGPDISVGLMCFSSNGTKTAAYNHPLSQKGDQDACYLKSKLKSTPLKITATENYAIKDSAGAILATIDGATETNVIYVSDGVFNISNSAINTNVSTQVEFVETDGGSDGIFTISPRNNYNEYRGKIKVSYSTDSKWVWVINTLPLEHYVWGMGEMTGEGADEHDKVMVTVFRTYGYWKIKFSTKYAPDGFKVTATTSSQLYYGYDWEKSYPDIKQAAQATAGNLVMYLSGGTNEIALTPYSSWTDGKTRSFQERWGSTDYPWCQSVDDPYGKNTTSTSAQIASMSTSELESNGNHMVGLSAHGSLNLAANYGWSWADILRYYYTGINLLDAY